MKYRISFGGGIIISYDKELNYLIKSDVMLINRNNMVTYVTIAGIIEESNEYLCMAQGIDLLYRIFATIPHQDIVTSTDNCLLTKLPVYSMDEIYDITINTYFANLNLSFRELHDNESYYNR